MSKLQLIIVAAVFAFGSQPAQATTVDSTFTFTGTCTVDCHGTANATLVLSDYTLGNIITSSNFVSLNYHSDFMSFSVTPTNLVGTDLSSIHLPLPGIENIAISYSLPGLPTQIFSTFVNGDWCVGLCSDAGSPGNGVWAETPLPAALPLFATGLGALGLLGWRRKRKARAVG
jgi:hypothetical protein